MKESVRIGLVGAGAIAQQAHLPVLSKMRGAELAAICDNDRPKARALADRFGIRDVVTDIEDLLELDTVDALVIATPNHLHEPHVLSALAAKRHVLCERPLSLTSRGVERIIAAAARADRVVAVANNHRYRTDVQALSRFIQGGELGKVEGMRAGSYTVKRVSESAWRNRRAEAGGGAFLEHGVALLDLALWLADYPVPVRVTAQMDRGRSASAVESAMAVQLECAAGISFQFDVSTSYVGAQDRWWFEALAARGSARLAPLRVVKELNGRATDVSPTGAAGRDSAFTQSYRAELAHFVSVVSGETPYDPPTDQVTLFKIVEAIYKSAEDGKEVRF